jgi:hypothetical protein
MGAKRERKQTHGHSDQYGEMKSQDREEGFQLSKGGSQTGGGTAGKSGRPGSDVKFERHVPKFLQPYAHMLGKGRRQTEEEEEAPATLEHAGADEDDADDLEAVSEEAARQLLHADIPRGIQHPSLTCRSGLVGWTPHNTSIVHDWNGAQPL